MTTLMERDKNEAKKKGIVALGAWGGSATLMALGFTFPAGAAAAAAGYFTYRWFMYRAKRGMRF